MTAIHDETNRLPWRPAAEALSNGIRVGVETVYLPARSVPHEPHYFFAYRITITNERPLQVRLLRRHWLITDAYGREDRVEGDGVVGNQPQINPGEAFRYTSFCPLPTEFGTMNGTYDLVSKDGAELTATIPSFTLARPGAEN